MLRPSFIHVGDRVLNLEAVRYIEIEGPHLVNVYITDRKEPLQFTEQDAHALVEILNAGYVHPAIEPHEPADDKTEA
jgi:hypothetical protein